MQARILDEVRRVAVTDDIKTAWLANGADFPNVTGAAFGSFVNTEIRRWASVVKASGAKLD